MLINLIIVIIKELKNRTSLYKKTKNKIEIKFNNEDSKKLLQGLK